MTGNMDILENMRKMLEAGEISKEDIVRAFPKLNESEDERIRKEIISAILSGRVYDTDLVGAKHIFELDKEVADSWLAYLEKQKEQRPTPKFKIGDVVRDTNHNRQPLYRIVSMDEECYICESDDKSLGDRAVVHFTLDNPYLRLIKQKPAEWSKEDRLILDSIIAVVEEWEDTQSDKEKAYYGATTKSDWLKSLYPQPHWKPSEEQILALKYALGNGGKYDKEALESLYNELSKL